MTQGEELELSAVDWGVSPEMQGREAGDTGQREKLTCDAAETSADAARAQDLAWSIRVGLNGGQVTGVCVSTLERHWQGQG